jgi:hypothetical protein
MGTARSQILNSEAQASEMEFDWTSTHFKGAYGCNYLTVRAVCDDSKRVQLTNKVYGAPPVTVLRALKNDDRLDASHFPVLNVNGVKRWKASPTSPQGHWGKALPNISRGRRHREGPSRRAAR